ncbi:hypothetical protein [Adhaeribacter rhizoryzae]|uniref:Uncharacterized protein n=1 Tax=Adhaeribacter rhizoryzae TaxID=2607907 RepID=A0A5M6CZZ3_9BACT|nr:hypothetical protein [Adhaeribacter rhizoryzae]KAA5540791.1 hypothetical protein F0145_22035 [Adhaeribacter rhizoryzae]
MMKQVYCKYLVLVFFTLTVGCQPEYVEPASTVGTTNSEDLWKKPGKPCPEYFYFYGQSKIDLGTVNTSKIILGFQEGITAAQKARFVAQFPYLHRIQNEFNTGSADATVVQLKDGLSCAQVEAILFKLAKKREIRYATPFFQSPFEANLLGITNQFIVNLKPGYSAADMKKLTKRTKTQIVEQLGDYTFILSADKYAAGHALQMANKFARFYQVESSEPDFYYGF